MCEFCTAHGEGKKWYLQIKNYAEEMLREELSAEQKELAKVSTRVEWKRRDLEYFVMPAITGVASTPPDELAGAPEVQLSEDELLEAAKKRGFGQVLPIEDLEQVVDLADSITRLACGCRFLTTGQTDKRYCFGLAMDKWGELGKFPDAASSLERLEKDEAKDVLHSYDEEGLIHTIWTSVTPYVGSICNCDRDCRPYKAYVAGSGPPRFFRAEYICQVDWDLCTGCKACMSQCQFGAQFYSSALEKVYIDPLRCFGCGVCRAVCAHEAIDLLPRQEHPEAAEIWLW